MNRSTLDVNLKWFMWLREDNSCSNYKSRPPRVAMLGPRYTESKKEIGSSRWHSESQILSLTDLTTTHRKRIPKMKVGTAMKWESIGLGDNIYLKRMSIEEINEVNNWITLNNELHQINDKIKQAIPELLKEKDEICSKISKERKNLFKKGVI